MSKRNKDDHFRHGPPWHLMVGLDGVAHHIVARDEIVAGIYSVVEVQPSERIRELEEALNSARETLYAAGTFASHANDTVREVGYMCLKEFEKIENV